MPMFVRSDYIEARQEAYALLLGGTTAHEIGHGQSEGEDEDHNEGGLMSSGGADALVDFSPISLERFRSTNSWE
jgi:hypothetical protein